MMNTFLLFVVTALFSGGSAKFADWNSWSPCTAACGKGWSSRERIAKMDECYTELSERKQCEALCERGDNVAINKTVTSSSTFLNIFPNRNAVDGIVDNDFYGGKSCMMTNKDEHPFLRIDLGGSYIIYEIIVHNRGDCCSERLNNFMVTVGFDKYGNNSEVCGKRELMGNTNITRIPCSKSIIGQFVQLSIPGPQFLSVCEVQVFGMKVTSTNQARGHKAVQSTLYSNSYKAENAVDGNYGTASMTTSNKNAQWWRVDFGRVKTIYQIRIYTSYTNGAYVQGCEIRIGTDIGVLAVVGVVEGKPKKQKNGYYAYDINLKLGGTGRFLQIDKSLKWDRLTLTEVEAYSYEKMK